MSYDVWVEMDADGPEPMEFGDWNYTSNTAGMYAAVTDGASLRDLDGSEAEGAAASLTQTIERLKQNPGKFRAMNPANGWGDYDSYVRALEKLRDLFNAYPRATVRVWA